MLFQLFDLDGKGGITKDELTTVLMSIVTPPNQVVHGDRRQTRKGSAALLNSPSLRAVASANSGDAAAPSSPPMSATVPATFQLNESSVKPHHQSYPSNQSTASADNDGDDTMPPMLDTKVQSSFIAEVRDDGFDIMEVQRRVDGIVEKAFEECDVDHSERLDANEFKQWISDNPDIISLCEELFVQLAWNGPDVAPRNNCYELRSLSLSLFLVLCVFK